MVCFICLLDIKRNTILPNTLPIMTFICPCCSIPGQNTVNCTHYMHSYQIYMHGFFISITIHCYGPDSHSLCCLDHPTSNLTPVGNEDLVDWLVTFERKQGTEYGVTFGATISKLV